jgi:hypothetical protein
MKRILLVCLPLALVAGDVTARRSIAQDPAEFLDHYRLIPRLSRVRLTGGIAGFNSLYRLTGEYDFRRGTDTNATAAFENAEVLGTLISDPPSPADELDVDEIFNLEGLDGAALPVAAPFDVYRFQGVAPDESSVELFAAVMGPWMFVRGWTEPPPGSADFFVYHIRALARSGPFADFNDDGSVDAADYVAWRDSGQVGGGDGIADYADWRQQFAETVPDIEAIDSEMSKAVASYLGAAAVPEPTGLALAVCGALLVAGLRRCRVVYG